MPLLLQKAIVEMATDGLKVIENGDRHCLLEMSLKPAEGMDPDEAIARAECDGFSFTADDQQALRDGKLVLRVTANLVRAE